MRALILDSSSEGGLAEMLARRRRWGADRRDEVWRDVLHLDSVLGAHADFAQALGELLGPQALDAGVIIARVIATSAHWNTDHVMDGALRLSRVRMLVEIVSSRDDTWDKLPFYADHRIDELLIVDPAKRTLHWLALNQQEKHLPVKRSGLIGLGPAGLAEVLAVGVAGAACPPR